MAKWFGAAGVCVNDEDRLLMVLQGKPDEDKTWSVPSGGNEGDESLEQTCIREVYEETGYEVGIVGELFSKDDELGHVRYYEVRVTGGEARIQDPDGLIYEIDWKSIDEIQTLQLSFPEDRSFLTSFMERKTCRS